MHSNTSRILALFCHKLKKLIAHLIPLVNKTLLLCKEVDQGVGSTSGIRACALRNFDLGTMELENSQNNALAKLPMLKLGEKWKFVGAYSVTALESGPSTALKMTVPSTAEEKICKKNDDDLYNNFKIVEQKVKRTAAANNDDKNLAFLTTSSPSSTNTINTISTGVSIGNTKVNTASTETSTASFSNATVYAFLSTQPQGSQLVHEDLEQLHDDDLEEMDLKWNMALLSMRARKFYQRTGKKIIIDGSSIAGYDKSKVECFNCHKMGHFARECRAPKSKDNRNWNQGSLSKAVRIEDASEKAMCAIDGAGFDWTLKKQYDDLLVKLDDTGFKASTYKRVREEEPKKAREINDAPIIEDWVSDDEEEVEPIPKIEKKTVIPTATKKESVKPEKPIRRSVSFDHIQYSCPKHMVPRAVLMKTGLKTVNNARPVNTVRTKDETSEILKNFIKEVENLVDKKVKIIRSDNGTEFKNNVMDEFCREKGIKREYSVARTPQQNGVAERKNRTLIEAARTMLADSKLPITFWAEAVSTACYVQNRVLIVKPHNKTPYELFRGIKPAIGFMKPFGCHVTILNTLDKLGKFDGKSDEGFFVGYSLSSKAFRVYNIRTRKVQENLHIGGNGPKRLFDLDSLTQSMNYVPVVAGTISNDSAGIQGVSESSTSSQQDQDWIAMPIWKDASYFGDASPNIVDDAQIEDKDELHDEIDDSEKTHDDSSLQNNGTADQQVNTARQEVNTGSREVSTALPEVNTATPEDLVGPSSASEDSHMEDQEIELGNIPQSYEVPTTPHTRIHKDHPIEHVIGDVQSSVQTRRMKTSYSEKGFLSAIYEGKSHQDLHTCLFVCFLSQEEPKRISQALRDPAWVEAMQEELLQFKLQKVWILVDLPKGHRAIGTKWVYRNKKDERGIVIRNKARLVAQGHTQEEGIDYDEVFAPVARIEAIRIFLAYASYMGFYCYKWMFKLKAIYGLHQVPRAWYDTLATYLLSNGFQRGQIDQTLFIKSQKGHILLVLIYVDDIIFGSTKKELCEEFEKLMKDKFQMSSMGELTFFLGLQVQQKQNGIFISQDKYVHEILKKFNYSDVKSASTPTDLEKPLVQDGDAADVDEHLYRSMIGSLMYLTASRPDIMFAVCACARFQVSPKTSHLLAVKRIFRYLKGKPSLGLWYSKDSPLELVAYTDSDYAGATQDRKSTTGGCQFLGNRLISWQCKKQTVVATSTTEAEYVAAASCCGQYYQMAKIDTQHNVADLLTKGFDAGRFQYLVSSIGMLNP
ncbi:putative ribonuclease H-like domain-containing protein [Tanacetum coccineum]